MTIDGLAARARRSLDKAVVAAKIGEAHAVAALLLEMCDSLTAILLVSEADRAERPPTLKAVPKRSA